jgi:hypothetical protein
MKRVRMAAVGAVLAAGLVGGSAVALTPGQIAKCQAATAKVNAIKTQRDELNPASPDPAVQVQFFLLSRLYVRALAQQARVC